MVTDSDYEDLKNQIKKNESSTVNTTSKKFDFDGDGKIGTNTLEELGGKSEKTFFNENKASLNRINIKYQRMFTGAFMYASSHHVGVGYSSIAGLMQAEI